MKTLLITANLGKAIFALALVLCISGITGISGAAETRGVSATEIRIGFVPDLTGPCADGARKFMWSMERCFQDINRAGGINGRKIKLFVQDGKYNPSIALSAFKRLVFKEKVFAMVANMGSAPVKAQLPLIEKYRVPLICAAVQSTWISEPPKKYVFSTMLSMGYCARVLIDYVVDEMGDRQPRIGVCYMNTEMGQEALRE
ncbi:MAG: ABC transporter substrate-binding protein, partial [Deltaproteobacteria bacterium]|nr:ABC transporter substrate-binding protein [Deltaproteobacteria bacterium]